MRTCRARNSRGDQCGATVMHDSEFCVFHDPAFADTLQEARKAGGQRKRREATVAAAYNLGGLEPIELLHRLWAIVMSDVLPMDNSLIRARVLLGVIAAGVKLREVDDHEERLKGIEAALGPRLKSGPAAQKRRFG